jgi:hypothetical protein
MTSRRIQEQFRQQRRGELQRLCSVRGCGAVTGRLNGLCHTHNNLRVRNGHETQRPIRFATIRHFADAAGRYGIITDADVAEMVAAVEQVKRRADDFLMTHNDPAHRSRDAFGQPYRAAAKIEYAARREIADSIGNLPDTRVAVKLVVGLTIIQEIVADLIKSDEAFLFQIARAVRRGGKPLPRGARSPVPTRKGVMVEAGRQIWEATARVASRLAHEVRLRDEREYAEKMRLRAELEEEELSSER